MIYRLVLPIVDWLDLMSVLASRKSDIVVDIVHNTTTGSSEFYPYIDIADYG